MRKSTMKEYDLHRLMNDTEVVEETIRSLQEKGILHQQKPDPSEIRGHLLKARHNLRFGAGPGASTKN